MACCVSLVHASVKIGTLLPAACRRCSLLASGLVYQLIHRSPPPLVIARFSYAAATFSTFIATAQCWASSHLFWCPWCMSLRAPWAGQPNKISVEFCMCKGSGRVLISVLTCRVVHAMNASSLINGPMCIMVFCLACFVRWFPNILGMGTCSLVMCVMVI